MSALSQPTQGAEWDAAVATGLIRIGAGALLWLRRDSLIRFSGGSPDDRVLRGLFRYFAVRDVALGVVTLAATRPGGDVPRKLVVQGVADTVDGAAVAALVTTGRLDRIRGFGAVALAGVTAAMEYAAAFALRRQRLPRP